MAQVLVHIAETKLQILELSYDWCEICSNFAP